MSEQTRCTNCGAAIVWQPVGVMECEYCHTKVEPPRSVILAQYVAANSHPRVRTGWIVAIVVVVSLGILGVVAGASSRATTISSTTSTTFSTSTTLSYKVEEPVTTPAPTAPPIAKAVLTVGQAGTNAGQLTHARALAVTPRGDIVVAEASTGRVQVFDAAGAYQRLISLPPSALTKELTVFGAGAGPSGEVVVSRAGDLLVLDVAGAKVARTIRGSYPEQFFHGDVDVVPDGSIYAITDRTGDQDVVHVSAAGKVLGKIAKADAEQLAVDGIGSMFLTRRFDDVVEVRDREGAVTRRFSQGNPARGKLVNPGPVAIDGHGHVFVAEGGRVVVFDVDGAFVAELDTGAAEDLAIDRDGRLYVLASDHVTKYELSLPR